MSESVFNFANNNSSNPLIPVKPSGKSPIKTPLYLIIVIHTLEPNNSLNFEIINGFETNANNFILSRTYGSETNNYTLNTKNYITVENGKDFKSRVHGKNGPQYIIQTDYVVYSKNKLLFQIKKNQCVFFYIYDDNNIKIQTFFTKGNLFIFENGIASTKSIQNYIKRYKSHNDDIINIINEYDFYQKDPFNEKKNEKPQNLGTQQNDQNIHSPLKQSAKGETKADTARRLANEARMKANQIKGGSVMNINTELNKKMKDINILYLNAILPNILFELLKDSGLQNTNSLTILKTIIKHLYVNISMPLETDSNIASDTFNKYNNFYKAIDNFYLKKNKDRPELYNTELKKEIKAFNQTYNQTKINIYIDLLNDKNNTMNKNRTYEKISFSMHIFDFFNFFKLNQNNKDFEEIFNTIYNNSSIKTPIFSVEAIKNIMPSVIKKLEENTKGIYTYLQIKNFDDNPDADFNAPYNERFNIKLDPTNKSMVMEYFNASFPFYKNGVLDIKPNTPGITLKQNQNPNQNAKINEIDTILYGSKFIFGKFNQIFDPKKQPKDIADNGLQLIVDKILEGKPVFLMGWGASGSGKTSSLVYYTKGNEPGILIYLCEKLRENGYNNIELECKELFESYEGSNQEEESPIGLGLMKKPKNTQVFNFIYNQGKGFLINPKQSKIVYNQVHNHVSKPPNFADPNLKLQNVMKYLIDDDRLVKATTNNPNSSRSHVLCFLKLTGGPKPANIIIGDLAGVENTFNCKNPLEIRKFFNVKRDGTNDKFYKDEIMSLGNSENIFDPIFGTEEENRITDDTKRVFQNFMNKPLFDFSNDTTLQNLKFNFIPKPKYNSSGYKTYINIILSKIDENLNTENLNANIITKGDSIIQKIDSLNINYNEYNDELAEKLLSVAYYSTWKNEILSKINIGMSKEQSDDMNKRIVKEEEEKVFASFWTEQNVKKVLDKIRETIIYIKFIKNACDNRAIEGSFINKSLLDLSQDLMNIVNHKNKNNVYYIPNIVDKCFPSYCPTFNKCFSVEYQNNPSINSIITKTIAEKLGYKNANGIYNLKSFFDNLEVAIFGVFNWSRIANNPPPVPYVDINIFSQMIFERDQVSFNMTKFKDELTKKINELIRTNVSPEAKDILESINDIIKDRSSIDEDIAIQIREKLEHIDKTNSLTAIGTIEFIDRISKLNSISNSCIGIDDGGFTNIYQKQKIRK